MFYLNYINPIYLNVTSVKSNYQSRWKKIDNMFVALEFLDTEVLDDCLKLATEAREEE